MGQAHAQGRLATTATVWMGLAAQTSTCGRWNARIRVAPAQAHLLGSRSSVANAMEQSCSQAQRIAAAGIIAFLADIAWNQERGRPLEQKLSRLAPMRGRSTKPQQIASSDRSARITLQKQGLDKSFKVKSWGASAGCATGWRRQANAAAEPIATATI